MPRNSSGTYSLPAGNPVVTGTVISSSWANTTLSDIATALTDSLSRSGDGGMLAPLYLDDGAVGVPSLSWSSETTTGLYRAGAGDIRYSISGTLRFQMVAGAFRGPNGVVGAPALSFTGDTDTGIYLAAANSLRAAQGGADTLQLAVANPTGTIGLTAVNGTAITPMRSDGAPALSQAIAPTWSATHRFTGTLNTTSANAGVSLGETASPKLNFISTRATVDEKIWDILNNGSDGSLNFRVVNDAYSTAANFLAVTRTAAAVTNVSFGNATNNNTFSFLGSGVTTFSGMAVFNALGTGSRAINISNILPRLGFTETDAAADTQVWYLHANGGAFVGAAVNDALSTTSNWLSVTRTASAINTISFGNATDNNAFSFLGTGTATFGGAGTFSGTITGSGPVSITVSNTNGPIIRFTDPDSGVNEKNWRMRYQGTTFTLSTENDDNSVQTNALSITRSGNVVNDISLGNATNNNTMTFLGTGNFTTGGVHLGPAGAVGAPTFSFSGDPNTGIYSVGADDIGVTVGGTLRFDISTTAMTSTLPLRGQDGTNAAPAVSFSGDTNTGAYRAGADDFTIAAGGTDICHFSSNAGATPQVRAVDGVVGNPAFSFNSDPDTGFYRDTANQIAISLGGTTAGQIVQGSYTGTLTGCTTSPTTTVQYQRIGKLVMLQIPPVSATSNASTMTITGAPAIIRPSTESGTCSVANIFNNTSAPDDVPYSASMGSTGTITFNKGLSGPAGFTSSGTKGISTTNGVSGTSMYYLII